MTRVEPANIIGFGPVTEDASQRATQRIVEALRPEKVILFGSFAYGRPTPHSDVDLLVVMRSRKPKAEREMAVSDLFRPRPFPMDILVLTPGELKQRLSRIDPFIHEVIEKGRVLYFAIDVRYPGEEPSPEQARLAVADMRNVRRFVRRKLGLG